MTQYMPCMIEFIYSIYILAPSVHIFFRNLEYMFALFAISNHWAGSLNTFKIAAIVQTAF